MASLAGAFGGILAWGIAHMRGVGGYNGWRWIFILVRKSINLHWNNFLGNIEHVLVLTLL